jgi:hypothetical protein
MSDVSTKLSSSTSLNTTNQPIVNISNPTSELYAYGIWVKVNTWDSTIDKYIFGRKNNIALRLDKTTPTLFCDFYMGDTTTRTITITDNFPIQRWCYVTISVDGQIIDCYLDGKLVKSQKLDFKPLKPSDSSTPIILGGNLEGSALSSDIELNNFIRYDTPVEPQRVWDKYLEGSQMQFIKLSTYNANLSILKDNIQFSKISLF